MSSRSRKTKMMGRIYITHFIGLLNEHLRQQNKREISAFVNKVNVKYANL